MPHVLLRAQLHFLQRRPVSLEPPLAVADRVFQLTSVGVLVGIFLFLKFRLEGDESVAAALLEHHVDPLHSFEFGQRFLLPNKGNGVQEVLPKSSLLAVEEELERVEGDPFESKCGFESLLLEEQCDG